MPSGAIALLLFCVQKCQRSGLRSRQSQHARFLSIHLWTRNMTSAIAPLGIFGYGIGQVLSRHLAIFDWETIKTRRTQTVNIIENLLTKINKTIQKMKNVLGRVLVASCLSVSFLELFCFDYHVCLSSYPSLGEFKLHSHAHVCAHTFIHTK